MRAGNLRERVAFERAAEGTRDAYGNLVPGWIPHLKTFGDVLETMGKERIAAGRMEGQGTATLRIRGSARAREITAADRVHMRGQIWQIVGIAEVGRKGAEIEFLCEREGAG